MLLNQIVEYCDENYDRTERCPDCQNECLGGCKQCLDNIHMRGEQRHYNCSNIAYFYTCYYSYRFASEIDRVLRIIRGMEDYDEYKVLSIGCGPCTSLMAFDSYLRWKGLDTPLNFAGVEQNPIWKPIHDKLKEVSPDYYNIRFAYRDIFEFLERVGRMEIPLSFNFLILQYVISDLRKFMSNEEVKAYLDKIFEIVVPFMPDDSIIIMNDINLDYKARNYFEYFSRKFSSEYPNSNIIRLHFDKDGRNHYDYGRELSSGLSFYVPANINNKYEPWLYCSSAQMVIRKNG